METVAVGAAVEREGAAALPANPLVCPRPENSGVLATGVPASSGVAQVVTGTP